MALTCNAKPFQSRYFLSLIFFGTATRPFFRLFEISEYISTNNFFSILSDLFSDRRFFGTMRLFSNLSFYRSPSRFLQGTRGFCVQRGLLRVLALYDLTETFYENNLEMCFLSFLFLERFSVVEQIGFLLFPIG